MALGNLIRFRQLLRRNLFIRARGRSTMRIVPTPHFLNFAISLVMSAEASSCSRTPIA